MTSTEDIINASFDLAAAVTDGRIKPVDIEAEVVAKCCELVGVVHGPTDPMWALQIDITRQVLHANGLSVDEVAEWLAVMRSREGVIDPAPAVSWIEQALADGADDDEPMTEAEVLDRAAKAVAKLDE